MDPEGNALPRPLFDTIMTEPGQAGDAVELRDIVMEFPGVRALDRVSVTFTFDRVHGLIGENGAGKSTLMSILAGTQRPTSGEILVEGRPLSHASTREAMNRGIALVSQEGSLVPTLTGAQNLLLGDEPARAGFLRGRELHRRARTLLEEWFPGVEIDLSLPVDRLAVADRKVVEIVRALRGEVRLLILDEPTATLPDREKRRLWEIIRLLPTKGVGVVLISHFLSEVKALSDRITTLRDGRRVDTREAEDLSVADMVELMLRRGMRQAVEGTRGAIERAGEPALSVRGWQAGGVEVPEFSLFPGEVVGLIGLTGAGHFAFARSLFTGEGVTAGTLTVGGTAVRRPGPRTLQRLGVGFVPDHRMENALLPDGTIAENLSLVHPEAGRARGFLSRRREGRASAAVMESLNVRATGPQQVVKTLSGGNKQKVSLGKWLYGAGDHYRALIFLEPTEGVDIGAKEEIYEHLRRFAEAGVAVLLASSDLLEIEQVTHRTIPFVGGRPGPALHADSYSEETFIRSMAAVAA